MLNDRFAQIVLAVGIGVGLIGGAAVLGRSIQDSRNGERYVTVRGVSEKEVKADLAIWPIKARVAGEDLADVNRSADAARKKVLAFLTENGIGLDEVASQNLRVLDRMANDFAQAKGTLRYIVEYTILVRSKDVDKLQRVSQMTDKLVAAGVVLAAQGAWERTGPQFIFTQLNTIKPGMMAEATRSAREVAKQFATDSGSKVGSIRKASQGLFSIADRDRSTSDANSGEGAASPVSDLNKKVRVVVNVDYFLDQ
jgi:hypothetical protein